MPHEDENSLRQKTIYAEEWQWSSGNHQKLQEQETKCQKEPTELTPGSLRPGLLNCKIINLLFKRLSLPDLGLCYNSPRSLIQEARDLVIFPDKNTWLLTLFINTVFFFFLDSKQQLQFWKKIICPKLETFHLF